MSEEHKPDMPKAFYRCNTCEPEHSCRLPSDLFWEPMAGEWICRECWFDDGHPTTDPLIDTEPKALSLETFLLRGKEQELAVAIKAERARVIKAVEDEPEFPGPKPEGLYNDLKEHPIEVVAEVFRDIVRVGKRNIIARIKETE